MRKGGKVQAESSIEKQTVFELGDNNEDMHQNKMYQLVLNVECIMNRSRMPNHGSWGAGWKKRKR